MFTIIGVDLSEVYILCQGPFLFFFFLVCFFFFFFVGGGGGGGAGRGVYSDMFLT